ncbi:MAG TPA: CRISPR-associated helicase Cas3' [Firmicutes bacterium]|nr:CRISPR-associated helicase Cas3' [Bacillota bacterium]
MVVPFSECIARPPDEPGGRQNLLSDHLLAVARSWGDSSGNLPSRLRFLAGLLHDAGKARARWQDYIREVAGRAAPGANAVPITPDSETPPPSGNKGQPARRGSVNHAPLGAALFFYCASALLEALRPSPAELRELRFLIIQLCYDIYDHHGELSDLDREPPWVDTLSKEDLEECDLGGIFAFIGGFFPELRDKTATLSCASHPNGLSDEIFSWLKEAEKAWEERVIRGDARLRHQIASSQDRYHLAAQRCLRERTSGLIAADRYDAAKMNRSELTREDAARGLDRLLKFCKAKGTAALASGKGTANLLEQRRRLQDECCEAYKRTPGEGFYTLVLPTGLGKTLTSLRVALVACASGRCRRILYVAPYLSILSQATGEIRDATGLEVLQHHHLSMLAQEELETLDSLLLESWQAPIVTTTFNQLFRALFPVRAQHTLRLNGLSGAFIIIDEPQVIDGAVWNLFLHMLQAATEVYGCQVLLSTATLPPLEFGISRRIIHLAPEVESPRRYEIYSVPDPLDEEGVTCAAIEELKRSGSVAVIMNTVADAASIYSRVKESLPANVACYNLTGCMTPLHKAHRIQEIASRLRSGDKVAVVCTQVLECGVDLSFRSILRARSTIPSIVQSAGRANRHAEGGQARVMVFQFLRDGELDTRRYVYRTGAAVQETDESLSRHPSWEEPLTREVVEEYYSNVMARNTNTAALETLVEAACGKWSALAGQDPFGPDYPHIDTFVPYGEEFLSPRMRDLLLRFAPGGCEELYERYLDKRHRAKLSFAERKRFMGLLQHFVVSLDLKAAEHIVVPAPEIGICRIVDAKLYSPETGLAHRVGHGYDVSDGFL